jgi:hypothetical protein
MSSALTAAQNLESTTAALDMKRSRFAADFSSAMMAASTAASQLSKRRVPSSLKTSAFNPFKNCWIRVSAICFSWPRKKDSSAAYVGFAIMTG